MLTNRNNADSTASAFNDTRPFQGDEMTDINANKREHDPVHSIDAETGEQPARGEPTGDGDAGRCGNLGSPHANSSPTPTQATGKTQPAAGDNHVPNPDPFDPDSLRLPAGMANNLGVKKVLTNIPVRKPEKSWFVRVHPDQKYRLATAVIELKDERGEIYLVAPGLRDALAGESTYGIRNFCVAINRQGVVFLWPVKLPDSSGRQDEWSRSAADAADRATKHWVRVQSNMSLGSYEIFVATGDLPEPEWPSETMGQLLKIAFRDRFIDSPDHPVLRKLRGEI